ncbi:carbamoyl-phosphate synthase large subunit [Cyanobium sp. Morenito 9A2]|uniref:carbamoyl-phosphate synthase large subunit n=1 Tax=Cyanobium sp. Morenito 9A2 TaxID=2823718 RepID=UPI0020CC443E|nr:carbamoyl-phosphate synthase large subunit [Cyanobium sp. Morenito 9A2]MCP9851189.1 carbamoyl-phosphate synthase large subunit [Cyanobium sp. Morenito 9A2]
MPRRTDLRRILLLGSGPIVIGQACEFDYSGTQACKALRSEGFEVVLVNSNPASIMTDPDMADRTYIEPLTPEVVRRVIEIERPDALLPTMGGQTALNLAVALAENGTLATYGVELIGANLEAIQKAEDRRLFKQAMERIGVAVCPSGIASTLEEAERVGEEEIGSYPRIIRPAFTLGGSGGGIAYNPEEFRAFCKSGLEASPVSQILIERSLIGWKEFELEVMRDLADNVVIICSIENLDPMGVHTGDSITVAPAQTLTDREYQRLRDQSIAIIREIGVETGGSNIQFAINPANGDVVVIEMNPRVSRSSALASKATGFPIAKIAARLAVGYTLDEILNDITGKTPACFEPTIDYVVTKIPRFAFEKFRGSPAVLTTSMKSVGEAMAIGRSFEESFQKAVRSLETGHAGWGCDRPEETIERPELERLLRTPAPDRIFAVRAAMVAGRSDADIHQLSAIDPWFLAKLRHIVEAQERLLSGRSLEQLSSEALLELKQLGFSDRQIAWATGSDELSVRRVRQGLGVNAVFKTVDTCAAEFASSTPYHYATYERPLQRLGADGALTLLPPENEVQPESRRKVMILGGGPNRIGQGIEFDYCCVHASFALQDEGFATVMVNSNPETVSTDYDTSDRLYFEPLTLEDVMNVIEAERPEGVIVQFGGQTPLKLALPLQRWLASPEGLATGTRLWGTSPESIDSAEDREQFEAILRQLDIRQPRHGLARSEPEARAAADRVGYPVVVRPSYVLGGRAMEVVFDQEELNRYMVEAVQVEPDHPVLIDQYLENAIEVDVDALADRTGQVVIGGLMEHIEPAGIHSGDSACALPSVSLDPEALATIRGWSQDLALALKVCGLINLQFAVRDGAVFIIEANPRASRTVPFVAKATGVPLAKIASRLMAGRTLAELGLTSEPVPPLQNVKEAVLPFKRFPGSDSLLGPEMRSTGEVMGSASSFGMAYAKAELAAGEALPTGGMVFLSTHDRDKLALVPVARGLAALGFSLIATTGTARVLQGAGLKVESILKVHEGRPNIEDAIRSARIQLIINTPIGRQAAHDDRYLRRAALDYAVPTVTTLAGARAAVEAITALQAHSLTVRALQDIHAPVALL